MKDTLFPLPPGFEDNQRVEYCPECAEMFRLLAYYPSIRDSLQIVQVGIEKPRLRMTEILAKKQDTPTFRKKLLL